MLYAAHKRPGLEKSERRKRHLLPGQRQESEKQNRESARKLRDDFEN
jgi:hypothetical protein